MIDIAVTYHADTRLMEITSAHKGNEAIGGTIGDANSTTITFTFDGTHEGYDVKLAVAARVKQGNNEVINPEFALTNSSVTLPGYVMSAATNGRLPIQLHFTNTDGDEFFANNQIDLRILPAIGDLLTLTPVPPPSPAPWQTRAVIEVTYNQNNGQFTYLHNDNTSTVINSGIQLKLAIPDQYDKVSAQSTEGLKLTLVDRQVHTHGDAELVLATKEYVDAHTSVGTYEVIVQQPSDHWTVTLAGQRTAANIQTFTAIGGNWYEVFGDIEQNGQTITVEFNSAISGKMVIS